MKVRYKISTFSSENPSHPVINLISGTGDWQSVRFPTYPQQITLLFYQPITISKIKLISHQNKVSQKINLLYHLPTPINQNQFTKIGYFLFKPPNDSLSQINTEKKTVLKQLKVINNLQLKALYLRLIFHPNHPNKTNIFNQVGLSCLQIYGDGCDINISRVELKNDTLTQVNNLGRQKITLLNQFKEKCIQKQQYNEAKQIKEIIGQVTVLLKEIQQLNREKIKLVHQQDYSGAKQVKQEIAKIKDKIEYMSNHFYDPQSNKITKFSIENIQRKLKSKFDSLGKYLNTKDVNQQVSHDVIDQRKSFEQPSPVKQAEFIEENKNQSTFKTTYQHEQQVVPALLNKLKKLPTNSDGQLLSDSRIEQQLPAQPEQLSPSNEANASILSEFYEKLTIKKLHSKFWQFKNQAIQQIIKEAQTKNNISKNQLRAYIFVYNRIMSRQNNNQLILSVIQLMNLVLGMKIQEGDFRNQMTRELEKGVIQTLAKTQQNQNPKVKMQAQKVIIRMIQSMIFGSLLVFHAIIKSYDDKMSPKLKRNYLNRLQYII